MSKRSRTTRHALAAATAVLTVTLAACGADTGTGTGSDHASAMPGMNHGSTPSAPASGGAMASMPGMAGAATGNGLAAAQDGYRMTSTTGSLPAGKAAGYRFAVTGPDGSPVTGFAVDQTKRMHFYAVRSDLTGFQHLHPVMAADGTWTAPLAALRPGTWRLYASFTPDSGTGKARTSSSAAPCRSPARRWPLPCPRRPAPPLSTATP
ncbi:hypothetical protein [Streptomyces sp. NPDC008092]|uniref:hypothetical protein n=1 Tax=Streptomyces sp. NPDC008092 TaxID=3364808 RepID=UPI0036E7F6D0